MIPPDEGLQPEDPPLGHPHDRLVDDAELLLLESGRQVPGQAGAPAGGAVDGVTRRPDAALAGRLGRPQREVGLADRRGHVVGRVQLGHADAAGDAQEDAGGQQFEAMALAPLRGVHRPELGDDPLGERRRLVEAVGDDDGELVATRPPTRSPSRTVARSRAATWTSRWSPAS